MRVTIDKNQVKQQLEKQGSDGTIPLHLVGQVIEPQQTKRLRTRSVARNSSSLGSQVEHQQLQPPTRKRKTAEPASPTQPTPTGADSVSAVVDQATLENQLVKIKDALAILKSVAPPLPEKGAAEEDEERKKKKKKEEAGSGGCARNAVREWLKRQEEQLLGAGVKPSSFPNSFKEGLMQQPQNDHKTKCIKVGKARERIANGQDDHVISFCVANDLIDWDQECSGHRMCFDVHELYEKIQAHPDKNPAYNVLVHRQGKERTLKERVLKTLSPEAIAMVTAHHNFLLERDALLATCGDDKGKRDSAEQLFATPDATDKKLVESFLVPFLKAAIESQVSATATTGNQNEGGLADKVGGVTGQVVAWLQKTTIWAAEAAEGAINALRDPVKVAAFIMRRLLTSFYGITFLNLLSKTIRIAMCVQSMNLPDQMVTMMLKALQERFKNTTLVRVVIEGVALARSCLATITNFSLSEGWTCMSTAVGGIFSHLWNFVTSFGSDALSGRVFPLSKFIQDALHRFFGFFPAADSDAGIATNILRDNHLSESVKEAVTNSKDAVGSTFGALWSLMTGDKGAFDKWLHPPKHMGKPLFSQAVAVKIVDRILGEDIAQSDLFVYTINIINVYVSVASSPFGAFLTDSNSPVMAIPNALYRLVVSAMQKALALIFAVITPAVDLVAHRVKSAAQAKEVIATWTPERTEMLWLALQWFRFIKDAGFFCWLRSKLLMDTSPSCCYNGALHEVLKRFDVPQFTAAGE